jgi:tetratricopeptide (TPR) repeat protein
MKIRHFLPLVFLLFLSVSKADVLTDIAQAAELYKTGDYPGAVLIYERLIQEEGHRSADLYYNLGNSYFKLTDYPSAILNYERALKMNPSDEDIRFNLDIANSKIEDKIETLPVLFYKKWYLNLRNSAGQNTWAILFILFLFASGGCFFMFFLSSRSGLKQLGFYGGLTALLVSILFLSLAFSMRKWQKYHQEAIVFAGSVSVKSSPVENGTSLFLLHAGTKVTIVDELGGWRRIKLADGNEGWMPGADLELI